MLFKIYILSKISLIFLLFYQKFKNKNIYQISNDWIKYISLELYNKKFFEVIVYNFVTYEL